MCFINSFKSEKCGHFLPLLLTPCKHRREYDAYCPRLTLIPDDQSPLHCPDCFEAELTAKLWQVKADQDKEEARKAARRAARKARAELEAATVAANRRSEDAKAEASASKVINDAEMKSRPSSIRRARDDEVKNRKETPSLTLERAHPLETLRADAAPKVSDVTVTAGLSMKGQKDVTQALAQRPIGWFKPSSWLSLWR